METAVKLLQAVSGLIEKLTASRVFLLMLSALSLVIIAFMYDNRQALFTRALESPILAGAGGVAFVIFCVAWIFNTLVNRADERNEAYIESMKSRVADLQIQLRETQERLDDSNERFTALLKLKVKEDE